MSFLVVLDDQYKIFEIKWSDPVYLVTNDNNDFISLVIKGERELLIKELNCVSSFPWFPENKFTFIDYDYKISLCIHQSNNKTFVFGFENEKFLKNEIEKTIKRFMVSVKENYIQDIFSSDVSVKFQFEKIQKLNSELIDTRRLLEKTNNQLKEVNKVLHNHLVKDSLTGLVSKYQYVEEIQQIISKNPNTFGIFTFIDIDDFKKINDTYGHGVGDDYLIEFANRLKALPIDNIIRLRIAGDEFGLFTYGLSYVDKTTINLLWETMKQTLLSKPIELIGEKLNISISAGMSVYGKDTDNIYQLIEFADKAMYVAKKSGKNKMSIFSNQKIIN